MLSIYVKPSNEQYQPKSGAQLAGNWWQQGPTSGATAMEVSFHGRY